MATPKLSANQQRRVEEIEGFLKTVALVKKLVGDLEANRAARPQILEDIGQRISRELFKMRQRAVAANVGTVADVAGSLATVAKRSVGLQMKIRALNDGVASLRFQLDRALAMAQIPDDKQTE
ncbi:MAG TPA: hypothetical protein VJ816_08810 [Gemmatimonadales bacterium]|jgi:hypothetical protein|nr:hypothetical protein [Gemmatimonadales bacterium]